MLPELLVLDAVAVLDLTEQEVFGPLDLRVAEGRGQEHRTPGHPGELAEEFRPPPGRDVFQGIERGDGLEALVLEGQPEAVTPDEAPLARGPDVEDEAPAAGNQALQRQPERTAAPVGGRAADIQDRDLLVRVESLEERLKDPVPLELVERPGKIVPSADHAPSAFQRDSIRTQPKSRVPPGVTRK